MNKQKILNAWKHAKEDLEKIKFEDIIIESEGYLVDTAIMANGTTFQLTNNGIVFCNSHGINDSCPDCTPIVVISNWKIEREQGYTSLSARKDEIEDIVNDDIRNEAIRKYNQAITDDYDCYDSENNEYTTKEQWILDIAHFVVDEYQEEARNFIQNMIEKYQQEVDEIEYTEKKGAKNE